MSFYFKNLIIIKSILLATLILLPTICLSKLNVFVTIVPQSYLLENIGKDKISVNILVQSGQSPHTYEPTPKQMIELGKSKFYFKIDAPFENKILSKVMKNNKNLLVINTAKGIKKRKLDNHKNKHHNVKEELDPHIWFSPITLKIQAKNIVEVLEKNDIKNKNYYRKNYNLLIKNFDRIHEEIKKMLGPFKGRKIFVFHPAFGYFTDAYGLKQEAVEIEGKLPSPKRIKHLIEEALKEKVKVIFVQPQFAKESAEVISRAIKGKVVFINPLQKNIISNLKLMAISIKNALER